MSSHTISITEGDYLPGYYAARAALNAKTWRQVVVGVTNEQHEYARALKEAGAQIVPYAANNPKTHGRLLEGVSAIVIVPPAVFDGADQLGPLLDSIEKAPAPPKAIVASTMVSAQFDPDTVPDQGRQRAVLRTWHDMESCIKDRFPRATIIRSGLPLQDMFLLSRSVQQKGYLPLGGGDSGKYAPVDLKDVFEALVCVAHATVTGKHEGKGPDPYRGQTFVLTGNTQVTNGQLAKAAADATGAPITYQAVTPDQMRAILVEAMGKESAQSPRGEFRIAEWTAVDALISQMKLAFVSGDLEKLLGRDPASIKTFFAENQSAFRPQQPTPATTKGGSPTVMCALHECGK